MTKHLIKFKEPGFGEIVFLFDRLIRVSPNVVNKFSFSAVIMTSSFGKFMQPSYQHQCTQKKNSKNVKVFFKRPYSCDIVR